ncbi:MAG: hypothetical protein JW723_05450 [Bacteroidales bacterium]|nr:hypothetical protein [Bacteroidales bacterium]
MVQQFTFRKHLFYRLLLNVRSLVPGFRQAIASYYDHEEDAFLSYQLSNGSDRLTEVEPDIPGIDLDKERLQNNPYSWYNSKATGHKNTGPTYQMELNDEFDNNILLVRLNNRYHPEKDLFLIYMEEGMGLFPLETTEKRPVNAREKSIIGQLLYRLIRFLDEQHQDDSEFFSIFNESFINTIRNLDQKQAELKSMRQNYAQSIISFCNYHLTKISEESDYKFRLSDKAIEKISDYKDKFEFIEKIITNAAAIALNRKFGKTGDTIMIDDTDVVFHSYEPEIPETIVTQPDRFARTREILDRYENAAIRVLEKNLPVTGKNIGAYCSPGISPAAITDAIHKHGRKMLALFDKNPNKWPSLRNKFRPIINLEQNNRNSNLKIAN